MTTREEIMRINREAWRDILRTCPLVDGKLELPGTLGPMTTEEFKMVLEEVSRRLKKTDPYEDGTL